jgi:hypothetical protein
MKIFKDYLDNIEYPGPSSSWNIAGTIKGQNGFYKFDLSPLKNNAKKGFFKTKADKIVVDIKNQWIIIDTEELHRYLKENNIKIVQLEDLLSKLEWNIVLPK